ncbi:MAG: hypothetical protein PHT27_08190 [Candidatus Izemoplasmatales bacterium]|nr:hypothetical protein [Candidatus Izemoplasmatales bacterium]
MKTFRTLMMLLLLTLCSSACFAEGKAPKTKEETPAEKKETPAAKEDALAIIEEEQQEAKKEAPPEEDVCSFNNNAWLSSMENNPLVDVPGEVGSIAFGGTGLVAGIPLVLLGQIFYFPFSGQKYFYPGMKQMYFSYYDFIMNNFRYSGYYLIAAPMYVVKGIIWDVPVYLYEAAFGADQDKEQPYNTIR